jgi:hypothetical protein
MRTDLAQTLAAGALGLIDSRLRPSSMMRDGSEHIDTYLTVTAEAALRFGDSLSLLKPRLTSLKFFYGRQLRSQARWFLLLDKSPCHDESLGLEDGFAFSDPHLSFTFKVKINRLAALTPPP